MTPGKTGEEGRDHVKDSEGNDRTGEEKDVKDEKEDDGQNVWKTSEKRRKTTREKSITN